MTDHACGNFARVWQAVLDRELPPERLAAAAGCPACEGRAAFARLLLGPAVEMDGGVGAVPAAVLAEARRRDSRDERGTLAALLAVAAALLIGVGALTPARPPVPDLAAVPPARPVRVADLLADARASLGALPAFEIRAAAPPKPSAPKVPPEVAALPAAAKSGFSPLADSTRRAVDYFRREAGSTLSIKSAS